MGESFDPYHKWLGIPNAEQPANHYRLLGVALFERDREVIDAAAQQRMDYLQSLSGGDETATAQRLLTEVSKARLVLLSPEKKRAYDVGLQHSMADEPPEVSEDILTGESRAREKHVISDSGSASRSTRTNTAHWPLVAIAAAAVSVVLLVLLLNRLWVKSDEGAAKVDPRPEAMEQDTEQLRVRGVPHAQHEVDPANKSSVANSNAAPAAAKAITKQVDQSDRGAADERGSDFRIGSFRDSPQAASVEWRSVNGHVDTQPAGEQLRCRIRLRHFDGASKVFLVGSFNGWNTISHRMTRTDDFWQIVVPLDPGNHQYKFMVDDEWRTDPAVEAVGELQNHRLELSADGGGNTGGHVDREAGSGEVAVEAENKTGAGNESTVNRRDWARQILHGAGLYEGRLGVWYFPQANLYVKRQYGKISKQPNIKRALFLLGGRLPDENEMLNPPPRTGLSR